MVREDTARHRGQRIQRQPRCAGEHRPQPDRALRAEIELFKRQLPFILDAIVEHPETSVRDLEIVPPEERHLVLRGFHANRKHYDPLATLADCFEQQAARTPMAPALVFDGAEVTYGELNRRADLLATRLRARGVRRGAVTGICLERSIDLVVGIIAILKAGGAYMPVDPAWPAERQHCVLADSGARLVVTNEDSRLDVTCLRDVVLLRIDVAEVGRDEHDPELSVRCLPIPPT